MTKEELEKEAEEYDLVIRFKSNKPKYEIRDYIINHTLNEFDDLQMWDFKRSSEFAEPREKRVAKLEEKISILLSCKNCPDNKGGLLCQKEYEDKCLAQKIQYIKELQEEIAELKRGYHYEAEVINGKPTGKAILVPDSLAYAKSIIEQLMNMKNLPYYAQSDVIKKAKAFLH